MLIEHQEDVSLIVLTCRASEELNRQRCQFKNGGIALFYGLLALFHHNQQVI